MKRYSILYSFITIIGLSSCSIISMSRSELRETNPEKTVLSADCKVSSTGAIYMNFAGVAKGDFLPASTKIEFRDKLIYIDPVVIDDTAKADIIFITHAHTDHFHKPDIDKIVSEKTLIIGPKPVTKKLKGYNIKTITPGDTFGLEEVKCKVVEAYNLKKSPFSITPHKKSNKFTGYILSLDSIRIYHGGDTDFIPEMSNFTGITVAIVPIGTGNTAMNPEDAAKAINLIQPQIAIPIHYDLGEGNEETFKKLVTENIQVSFFHQPSPQSHEIPNK